jgi:hypothetical protein
MPRQPVKEDKSPDFVVLVWFNDAVVYDSRADAKAKPKTFRIRRAANTLVVECRSNADGAVTPADVAVQFNDAKDGQPINDLLFDVEKR